MLLALKFGSVCLTCPVSVFQNRMHLSAVPPPLASNPWWCGDHAMALTAAKCSVKAWTGCKLDAFQTNNLLSLPPEAKYWLSGDHLRPHTSCLWPTSLRSEAKGGVLTSLWRINLSLEPELKLSPFQAKAPTLAVWPSRTFNFFWAAASQIWT